MTNEEITKLVLTHRIDNKIKEYIQCLDYQGENERKMMNVDDDEKHEEAYINTPAGVLSPKLSRILPPKGVVSPSPAWLKKFEPTVIQNPMTIRRFFIIVIEKYLVEEFKEMRTD
ncbi:hypothetical protein AVEN_207982-1 [Araneus ventricosus]|uniref:Uncharacterized protein n=1 Tax=Araneus ventricosus TaxID=182803 RepID=A0A4Y2JAP4_ARAVE|nr:hypothetical protein AVEN_207982-1 [Araneus ventricosus]